MTDPTRSIPFEALHRALGARMGAFAGYQIIRRNGVVRVICSDPRHKQRQG